MAFARLLPSNSRIYEAGFYMDDFLISSVVYVQN